MAEVSILTVGCDWSLRQAPAGALGRPHSVSFAEDLAECQTILGERRFHVLVIGPALGEGDQNAAAELAKRNGARSLLLYAGNAAPLVPADAAVGVRWTMLELVKALEQLASTIPLS